MEDLFNLLGAKIENAENLEELELIASQLEGLPSTHKEMLTAELILRRLDFTELPVQG